MRVWLPFLLAFLCIATMPAWCRVAQSVAVPAQVTTGTPALIISPATAAFVLENEPVTFQLEVENAGAQQFVFSVSPELRNAELNQEEGVYRFHPDFLQAATYSIQFFADSLINQVSAAVTVGVSNNNRLPDVLVSFGNRLVMNENETARIQMFAVDPDPDDTLVYSVTPAIDNLVVNEDTGTVTFSPDFFQAGIYSVVFNVTDGHSQVSNPRTIEVRNVNRAPRIVLNPRDPQTIRVGETYNLLATITDPDLENLNITLNGEPENSTFNTTTGRFVFTPTLDNFREEYVLTFTASDPFTTTQIQTSITVDADIDPLFEFDSDGNFEGWTANEQIQGATVTGGSLRGQSVNIDPILVRGGLAIDTVAQRELVLRIFNSPPSPIELFFITRDGRFFGPLVVRTQSPNLFTTISTDFSTLFDQPEVIQSIRVDPMTRPGTFIIDFVGVEQTGLPTRTPLPIPSATPRPTFTPTATVTPPPSPTPSSTPTPAPNPPTPTPTPRFLLDLDFEDPGSVEEAFEVIRLQGLGLPTVRRNQIEGDDRLGGGVLEIVALPGQGALLLSNQVYPVDAGTPQIRVDSWLDSSDTALGVLAFNEPFDGSYGYVISFPGAIEPLVDQQLEFSYLPPDGEFRVGIQVIQPVTSSDIARIRFDNMNIGRLLDPFRSPLPLEPDGSLDGDLTNLFFNINNDTGTVQQIRDATQSVSIQLGVNRVQNAANIALFANLVPEQLADYFTADVLVRRQAGLGGWVDYVLTDGRSAVGQSMHGSQLESGTAFQTLQIGGRLLPSPEFVPPLLVIQHAGLQNTSAIRADRLRLFSITENE